MKRNLPVARLSSVIRAMIALALTAAAAGAQAPKVGDINFYGLHKVTPQKLLANILGRVALELFGRFIESIEHKLSCRRRLRQLDHQH